MNLERYTDRARGQVQAAQTIALREGHQSFVPEHILKALLDDSEGLAANLMNAAGGHPKKALTAVDAELQKLPRVEGGGAGQLYMKPETARLFTQAEELADKAGDKYVTTERLLLALALSSSTPSSTILKDAGITAQGLNLSLIHI